MLPIILLFIGGATLTVGDLLMKKWTVVNSMTFYFLGMVIYMIGMIFLSVSFKFKGIAVASILFIVFNVVTLAIAGWIFYNEPLSIGKLAGISLALIAVVVLEFS